MTDQGKCKRILLYFVEDARKASNEVLSGFTPDEIEQIRGGRSLSEQLNEISQRFDESTGKERIENLLSLLGTHHLAAALLIQEIVEDMDSHGGLEHMDPWMLGVAMFKLGAYSTVIHDAEIHSMEEFQTLVHSHRTSSLIVATRYSEDREDYIAAVTEAKDYWKNGGTDLHHAVAKRLAKKHRLNQNGLKSRLAPISKKYDRCFGLPGVKKIVQNPTT